MGEADGEERSYRAHTVSFVFFGVIDLFKRRCIAAEEKQVSGIAEFNTTIVFILQLVH